MRVSLLQLQAQGCEGCARYGDPTRVVPGVADGGGLFEWLMSLFCLMRAIANIHDSVRMILLRRGGWDVHELCLQEK